MDKKLKQAIQQSFTPPPPKHKLEFINHSSYPKTHFKNVWFSQIRFIRKRVWFFYIFSAFFAYFYTSTADIPENIVAVISAILPLFSLCMITELYKSAAYNMEETELACKYNLQKITLMRLSILGTVGFITLILLVSIANKNNFGIFRNSVYISVPYLLSTYISLGIISRFRTKETLYICTAVCVTISTFILISSHLYPSIYATPYVSLWLGTFVILISFTIFSFTRFVKSQEELQWNLL